jgi:hypothetical protein
MFDIYTDFVGETAESQISSNTDGRHGICT